MKPKPLVWLNHLTVPMLTGVVPSQDRYSRSPLSDGLVRSNFWKGRQRLNRLYRWIANVVRPKIDIVILFQSSPQNNHDVHDFWVATRLATVGSNPRTDMILFCYARIRSSTYLRRNWPRGGAPRGAPPP